MHILFLTQVLPYPLDAGPKVRAYYVLRYLARQHDVTLVSFVRASDTPEAVAHLRTYCRAVHTVPMARARVKDVGFLLESLVTARPFIITRDRSGAMNQLLRALATGGNRWDAVHADQLWMAPYALYFRERRHGDTAPLTVLDQHNAVYMILRRLASAERNPAKRLMLALEARKLAAFEVSICRRFDRVTWVTQEDYTAVSDVAPAGQQVPNHGVLPICASPEDEPPIQRTAAGRRVTFLGGLHYPPNAQGILWFAEHIFPRVLAQAPDAVLTVMGKQPPDGLHTLGIPAANLEVTGYVDDPRPYLAETAAFVVPLLAGGGMRVKIVDGWSWGLPIVSTTVGAEGIRYCDGENILIGDTPDAFAAHVVQLLQQPEVNARIADAGRAWALEQYNWRITYRAWDDVYAGAG